MQQEIGREEEIYGRTNHWHSAGGRSGLGGSGAVPQAWFLRGYRIRMAQQVWRHERVRRQAPLKELETENVRLKRLLAEAMLENEVTKEALRKKW